jgi:catalase (peroxidase I)
MGVADAVDTKPFTPADVKNKPLVIKMLNYEEEITKSDVGRILYSTKLNRPLVTLTIEHTLNRLTLAHFNFDTSDESVEMYRTIFRNYYTSPTEYDAEVMNAVHYMRENKCVYYTQPPLQIGDTIPDCQLFTIDGKNVTSLYDEINKAGAIKTVIAAFSLS